MKDRYSIEKVTWLDSAGYEGWHSPGECEPATCVSIGYISSETKDAITVTAHIDYSNNKHNSDLIIPKCAIVKRKRMR